MNNTVNYYNEHALEYFSHTFDFDNTFNQGKFMDEVQKAGYINPRMLDIGCGSCRDTVFFEKKGIKVLPIDVSDELAAIIKEKLDIDICVMDMSDISFEEDFELIWASASILHLDKASAAGVLFRCCKALKPGGLFYVSVKAKEDVEFLECDRYFAYYDKDEFAKMLEEAGFTEKVFWYTNDTLGRSTIWLNFIVQK